MGYDLSSGLSGAASGAATGAQLGSIVPGVGNAVGGAIGGALGLASGFFGGGGGGSSARDRAIQRNRESLRALTERYESRLEESPTDTAFFETGVGQLQEQADRQADRDAQQAAARGLGGSQFELAQDANRARTQSDALRSLVRGAEEMDNRNEQRAQRAVQRQRETLNALVSDQAQAERMRQARQGEAVRQSFAQLPFLMSQADFGFGGDGGGGGSNLDALVDPLPGGGDSRGVLA